MRAATTAALRAAERVMSSSVPTATPDLDDSTLSVKEKVQLLIDMPATKGSAKVSSKCIVCKALPELVQFI